MLLSWWPAPALPAEAAPGPSYGEPRTACRVTDERLTEVSGIAVAGDLTYVVNDGGTTLQVFVLDAGCQVVDLRSAPVDPYDVEDLALAADGTLWLADIGDNGQDRGTVALHALRPDGRAELYRMTYPDGAHDAEALLLDPAGVPYLITKDLFGRSGVYRPTGPLTVPGPTPLHRVADIELSTTGTVGGPVGALGQLLVTGAAMSADGRLAVIRTYTDAYLYVVPDGDLPAGLRGTPVRIALPPAPQGEAIAFGAGSDLVLASEGVPFDLTVLPAAPGRTAPPGNGASADRTGSDPAPAAEATGPRWPGVGMVGAVAGAGAATLLLFLVAARSRRRPTGTASRRGGADR